MNHTDVSTSLEQILLQRVHGSISLGGYKFQLLYSINVLLDLLSDSSSIISIRFEGIEDLDIQLAETRTFIQAKSSRNKQGWSWLKSSRVLDNFADVYRADPNAKFGIVTNFDYAGDLKSFHSFTLDAYKTPPAQLSKRFDEIRERCNLSNDEMQGLVRAVHFEITDQAKLIESIRQKIVTCLDVDTGNEGLYFQVLFTKAMEFAVNRSMCHGEDLRKIQLEIQEWISAGPKNLAVTNGWIEPLSFQSELEENELDYYEGKGARPAHIVANVDAERPEWTKAIHDSLSDKPICIVRSSSGQGKSTLLYRYAYTYFDHHTTFVLKKIQDSDEIAPLERFLESRLKLGLPVLVLVNDLNERVRLWHELAGEFAGRPILFLIASREENWYRYAGNLHNLQWKIVKPQLSVQEAKDIYRQFKNKGRIANNVKSAAWAYDKVSDKKLLIEFVYLITHGQMLSERLEDQIATIHRLSEDPAKIHILRLTSLAQVFDVRLPIESLLSSIEFQTDPHLTMRSLIGEYLDTTEDGYVEGLHYVRSEHLVTILHDPLPITLSAIELFDLVPEGDLSILTRSAFSHSDVQYNNPALFDKLHEKTGGDLTAILEIVRALFRADECRYLNENNSIVGEFLLSYGSAELVTYFANANMPASDSFDIFQAMRETGLMPEDKLNQMEAMVKQMPDRDSRHRFTSKYLAGAIPRLTSSDVANNVAAFRKLLIWVSFHELTFDALHTFLQKETWQEFIFTVPINESAEFMYLLWQQNRTMYNEFVSKRWLEIVNHYRVSTDTLSVIERQNELYIEFVIDEIHEIHDSQTIGRLRTLMHLLPHYESYSSQGLYPLSPIARLPIDESRKTLKKEVLNLDIAEINACYITELELVANSDSLYEWLSKFYVLRAELVNFAKALIERHESMLKGKGATELDTVLARLNPVFYESRTVPESLRKKFPEETKHITEWEKSISNFVHTYLNNRALRTDHLYLHNLFVALGQLQEMQDAFNVIIKRGESYFQPSIDTEDEFNTYRYLHDLFDYWVSVPENRILQHGVKPRTVVSAWKKSKRRELRSKLVNSFRVLVDNGVNVHLPDDYFEEPPQRNLCFAVELRDATCILEHVPYVYYCLHESAVSYDYVYIVPVINCKPVQSMMYSAPSDAANRIAKGEHDPNEICIYPTEIPDLLFQIISAIDREVLSEWQYYLRAQQIFGRIDALRNEVALVNQRVGDDLPQWRAKLLEGIKLRLIETEDVSKQLIQDASRWESRTGSTQWNHLWSYFAEYTARKTTLALDVEGFEPVAPNDDHQLMTLYGEYLNIEYIQR